VVVQLGCLDFHAEDFVELVDELHSEDRVDAEVHEGLARIDLLRLHQQHAREFGQHGLPDARRPSGGRLRRGLGITRWRR